jgi:predicted nucleic acid-binding protein
MIALDTQILVYAHREDAPFHSAARRALTDLAEGAAPRAIPGPVVHDARIAALCLDHRVNELWSADRDFSRFKGLRVRNPL